MKAICYQPSVIWKPLAILAGLLFMYWPVLSKLVYDWWTDDNYSHGLLIPFLIGLIVWQRLDGLKAASQIPRPVFGLSLIIAACLLLLAGTMASVLFAQRLSLLLVIGGVVACFFGLAVVGKLGITFLLIVLAIPIPQIIFNKIAFPLQIFASRLADLGIRLLDIPVKRYGNVIDIPFIGTGEIISLEVVEACSGIRSLMTLATIALILGYFTRADTDESRSTLLGAFSSRDALRTLVLMAAAVPIALVTNAGRVMITGILAHHSGRSAVDGSWHDISGSIVFFAALGLLFGFNFLFARLLDRGAADSFGFESRAAGRVFIAASARKTLSVLAVVLTCGILVNWFQYRGEIEVPKRPLSEIPSLLGNWERRNDDIRFDTETEKVLKATDYVMRDYYGPGKRLNLYVGYYASQRSGSTYHSPLSCLPGTGWELTEPELFTIMTAGGRRITVNLYIVKQGEHREYLLYWYQGRGRTFSNEYEDKLFTSLDSLLTRRSDGGMVRIMTPLGKDPERSLAAAVDLTGLVADRIGEFVPN